jgi:hypothetical protein
MQIAYRIIILPAVRLLYGKGYGFIQGPDRDSQSRASSAESHGSARLNLEIRGREIVLSPEPAWKKLRGAGAGHDLVEAFAAFKKREREREDARP